MAFKTPVISSPTPTVPVPPDVVAGIGNLQVNHTLDNVTKEQMVQAMAQMSGMNIEWSQKYVILFKLFKPYFTTTSFKLLDVWKKLNGITIRLQ